MRVAFELVVLPLLFCTCAVVNAVTPGSFRGTIVDGPQASAKNWIYVQGRNGMARRVDISRAQVTYDENVPTANRSGNPADALKSGTEVRVTAEQGSDGEWKASAIEILRTAVTTKQSFTRQSRLLRPCITAA